MILSDTFINTNNPYVTDEMRRRLEIQDIERGVQEQEKQRRINAPLTTEERILGGYADNNHNKLTLPLY